MVMYPLELAHISYLTIKNPCSDKDVNVLIITDHFTWHMQAVVTTSQTTQVTAKALWNQFLMHYGFPDKILSDQDNNFEGTLIKELCTLTHVKKLRTTPYHPEGNDQCEQFNSTLISMISILNDKDKSHWRDFIPTLVHVYNCMQMNAIEFSTHYLMFESKPRLTLDLHFSLQNATQTKEDHQQFGKWRYRGSG